MQKLLEKKYSDPWAGTKDVLKAVEEYHTAKAMDLIPKAEEKSFGQRVVSLPYNLVKSVPEAVVNWEETAKGLAESPVALGEKLGTAMYDKLHPLTDAQQKEVDTFKRRRDAAWDKAKVEREFQQKTGYTLPPEGRDMYPAERQRQFQERGVEPPGPHLGVIESIGETARGLVEPFAQLSDVLADQKATPREKARAFGETALQVVPATGVPIYATQRAIEVANQPREALMSNPAQTMLDMWMLRKGVKARNEAAKQEFLKKRGVPAERVERVYATDVAREEQNQAQYDQAMQEQQRRADNLSQARKAAMDARNARIAAVKANNDLDSAQKRRIIAAIQRRGTAVDPFDQLRPEERAAFKAAESARKKVSGQLEGLKQPGAPVPDVTELYDPNLPGQGDLAQMHGDYNAAVDLMDEAANQIPGVDSQNVPKSVERRQLSVSKKVAAEQAKIQARIRRAGFDLEAFDNAKKAQLEAIESRKRAADPKLTDARRAELVEQSRLADQKAMAALDEYDKAHAQILADIAQRKASGAHRPEYQKYWDMLQKQKTPKTPQRIQDLLQRSREADLQQEQRIAKQRAQLENRLGPNMDRLTTPNAADQVRPEYRREWRQLERNQQNPAQALRPELKKNTAASIREQIAAKSRRADMKRMKVLETFDNDHAETLSGIEQRSKAATPDQQLRPEFQSAWAKLEKQNTAKTPARRQALLDKSRAIDESIKADIAKKRQKLEGKLAPQLGRLTAPDLADQVRPQHKPAFDAAENQQNAATQKSLARDAQEAADIAAKRAELEKAKQPAEQDQAALEASKAQYDQAQQEGRTQAQTLLEEQQRRVEAEQQRVKQRSQQADTTQHAAVAPVLESRAQAVKSAKEVASNKSQAAQRFAKRMAQSAARIEGIEASAAEIKRNRPFTDRVVYHPDFALRGKVGAALEKGLGLASPIDLALATVSKLASLHPKLDVLLNPRDIEARRPLRVSETAAKTESEASRQRLTDVAENLPEEFKPETYERQRRDVESSSLPDADKKSELAKIDASEKRNQRKLTDLWDAAHELVNQGLLEMNPDAPKGKFFTATAGLVELQDLAKQLNDFDSKSNLWREARRTSAESMASGGFGGLVSPDVATNIAERNQAIQTQVDKVRDIDRKIADVQADSDLDAATKQARVDSLNKARDNAIRAAGNKLGKHIAPADVSPAETLRGKESRARTEAEPNLWHPNVYPEEQFIEGVYRRAIEKGLRPEDAKFIGEDFPANQPLTPSQAVQYISDRYQQNIKDVTPGNFRLERVPDWQVNKRKGAMSRESTAAVEGRGLAPRTMRQATMAEREAYGLSTDPRQAIAALHQENVDSADRNMWARLKQDANVVRTIQPNEPGKWVLFDNRATEFGRPYGENMPDKFWVRGDISQDMALLHHIHELQSASLVQGRGNVVWGGLMDVLRLFKAAHTKLSPSSYGTNIIGNLGPQAVMAGVNPFNLRFIGKVAKAFFEATGEGETQAQRQFALDRQSTTQGFIGRAEANPQSIRDLGGQVEGLVGRVKAFPQQVTDITKALMSKREVAPEFKDTPYKVTKGTPEQARQLERGRQAFRTISETSGKAYSAMDDIPRQALYEYFRDVEKMSGPEAARRADLAIGQTTDLPGLMRYLSLVVPFTFTFPAAQLKAALGFMRENPARFQLWSQLSKNMKMDATHKAEVDEIMREIGMLDKSIATQGAGRTREQQRRSKFEEGMTPFATVMPRTMQGEQTEPSIDIGKYMPGDTFAPKGSEDYGDWAGKLVSRNVLVDTAAKLMGKDLARPWRKEMSMEERLQAIADSYAPLYQAFMRVAASAKGEAFRGAPEKVPLEQSALQTLTGVRTQLGQTQEQLTQRADKDTNRMLMMFQKDYKSIVRRLAKNPQAGGIGGEIKVLRDERERALKTASANRVKAIESQLRLLDALEERWKSAR